MNSVETYQKRLRDEVSVAEKEIQSHNQQIEALNKRLEGLKRAVELFESEQPAIAELLRTYLPDGDGVGRGKANAPAATPQNALFSSRATPPQKQTTMRGAHNGRGKAKPIRAHPAAGRAGQDGGLKRVDMIAATLKRHRRLSVNELLAALDKEFGWKTTESSVTVHLYTNRNRFVHTKADRSAKRPIAWSLK